jgi:DNA-binding transcriptional MocR family regulator
MTPGRRTAIAEVVQRHGVALIEDDAYGLLPETPPPAIATLVPAQSYYVATTAKCLSPGLRTAFLVVPPGQHAQRVTQALRAVMMMASPLLLGLVTLWIREGTALAIRDGIRREARARQAIARAILPDGLYAADPEGLHVWLRLPPHWGQAEFVAYVRDRGLALVPSDAFHLTGRAPHAVRIALGAAPDHERLREALVSITESLQQPMPAFFADVV